MLLNHNTVTQAATLSEGQHVLLCPPECCAAAHRQHCSITLQQQLTNTTCSHATLYTDCSGQRRMPQVLKRPVGVHPHGALQQATTAAQVFVDDMDDARLRKLKQHSNI
jgi:hypothetical protein